MVDDPNNINLKIYMLLFNNNKLDKIYTGIVNIVNLSVRGSLLDISSYHFQDFVPVSIRECSG